MKYVCSICGYVYDETNEAVPFAELPDSWVCPWCGAEKAVFEPEGAVQEAVAPKESVEIDEDMQKLTMGQLAALCSNLARGCEKQYQPEASALYAQLSEYFTSVTPAEEKADGANLLKQIQDDLETGYPTVRAVAEENGDRGALRVCVWGEKVTRILNSLLQRYEKEGEAFLANTEIWVCTTCGFVYVGDTPPALCPVCKVPDWKFEKVGRRGRA